MAARVSTVPSVDYAADGLPVVYDAASQGADRARADAASADVGHPRGPGPDRGRRPGPGRLPRRLVDRSALPGPDPRRPDGGDRAGTVDELLGPTAGVANVFVSPAAGGIDVLDCCGVGVADVLVPYVDADGAPLPTTRP